MKRLVCFVSVVTLLVLFSPQKAEARARTCSAHYTVLNSGSSSGREITLGWIDLGTVRGIPRRKVTKCREKAQRYLNQPGRYRDFGLSADRVCQFSDGVPIRVGTFVRDLSDPGYSDIKSGLGAACTR